MLLFSQAERFGVSQGHAVRISLASAGVWWAVFTVVPLVTLRDRQVPRPVPPGENVVSLGLKQLWRTLRELPRYPHTLLFLGGYLLFNDGIQSVIGLSSQFGQEELGMPISELTLLILMVQFIAFGGALSFGHLAGRFGTKRTIMTSLFVWIGVLEYAYGFLQSAGQFFALGAVIAIVLGGTQALSRSAYSQMIPRGQEAEYFSLYEVGERGTSWLGPLLYGLAYQFTGSYRIAILSLVFFFVSGLLLLTRVDIRRAALEAGNVPPSHS